MWLINYDNGLRQGLVVNKIIKFVAMLQRLHGYKSFVDSINCAEVSMCELKRKWIPQSIL